MKSKTTALVLAIFTGGLGIDRFYLGYTGMGILKLLTCGCFGILWLIDLIRIATGSLVPADGSGYSEGCTTAAALVQPAVSAYDELEKLAKLHDRGIINDEEFNKMKAEILERL